MASPPPGAARLNLSYTAPSHISRFGPKLKSQPHFKGTPLASLTRYTPAAAGFGAAAGIFLLFFMEEVPPVRRDIFENLPIIGSYWTRSVPPEDNPF